MYFTQAVHTWSTMYHVIKWLLSSPPACCTFQMKHTSSTNSFINQPIKISRKYNYPTYILAKIILHTSWTMRLHFILENFTITWLIHARTMPCQSSWPMTLSRINYKKWYKNSTHPSHTFFFIFVYYYLFLSSKSSFTNAPFMMMRDACQSTDVNRP